MYKELKIEKLYQEIESARREMIRIGRINSLNSKEVIDASQKLDKLLNIYLNYKKKTKRIELL